MQIEKQNIQSAFLGISLGSHYSYSRKKIYDYLLYSRIHFSKFAFLIGDEIHGYTLSCTRDISIEEAKNQAINLGNEKFSMIKSVLKEINEHAEIFRWADVKRILEYPHLLTHLKNTYRSNNEFKRDVRNQIFLNLGERISALGILKDASKDNLATNYFDSYVLEEIAGIVALSEYSDYHTEIYPGNDLKIFEYIYSGKYKEVSEILPTNPKRQFYKITMD